MPQERSCETVFSGGRKALMTQEGKVFKGSTGGFELGSLKHLLLERMVHTDWKAKEQVQGTEGTG